VDETDIASVETLSLPLRCILKNPSKERHAELGNQLWIGRRRGKEKIKSRMRQRERGRERERDRVEGVDLAERSLEGFGSADAYNRPSLVV